MSQSRSTRSGSVRDLGAGRGDRRRGAASSEDGPNHDGATNGRKAAPGTIRGDFGLSQQMNLIHGSDSPASAAREMALYFTPGELTSPAKPLNHTVGLEEEFGAITEPE